MKLFFKFAICVLILGVGFMGCAPFNHPEYFVEGGSLDVRMKFDSNRNFPRDWFTVKFQTADGLYLCGGRITVSQVPAPTQPATKDFDLVNSAVQIGVPSPVQYVSINLAYGPFFYGPYEVYKNDTTLIVSELTGGCK
ncbi:hypothetical protein C4546_03840 [Candidatus Parcubacteria bacterium]|jgi:hypothetical protein|nr:MAG: hypothetical protein C4546_03840 [Candidatus Parcubacteria bacterium]